ncbi:DUF4252 domain-containing protein [candidate division KSB1 bacterium]|nr:DUF4252 domain-containing protein [candidate division KSB1 bacterium]
MKNMCKLLLLFSFLGLIAMGCTNKEFNHIERSIKQQVQPAHLKTRFKFSFGPLCLTTIRGVVSLTDADEMAKRQLRNVSKVQVGVYEFSPEEDKDIDLKVPTAVIERLKKSGWEVFVRVKERDENVVVLFKELGKEKISLYVLSLHDEEVVIVEVVGNLEHMIEEALREKSLNHEDWIS